ncbi:MAG: GNAT family N-acetyltransferase [Thermomicrobiales bacterium]
MPITRPFLHDLPSEWIGERIVVRRWRDEDAQPLFDAIIESRERLRQWMAWADTYHSVDDAVEFIRGQSGHWALHSHIGTGIFTKDEGTLLGSIGLHLHDLHVPVVELGYWIRTSAEGHGYISEAVRRMTAFAFEEFGVQRLVIRCDARNSRSKAVAERLGFLFEGCHRRDSIGTDGAIRDTLVYAMIPDDYARVRETWV